MTLTREQFADALRKGHGRALAHVREHGDAGVEDLLLEACVRNLSYDPQCEDSRSGWLMQMLAAVPDATTYYATILSAFAETDRHYDAAQMAGMVRRMAENDVSGARAALYAKFDRQQFDEWAIAPHLVMLDGAEGLLHVARGLGRRLATDSEFWLADTRGWFEEELGPGPTAAILDEAADTDEDVRRFRDASTHREDGPPSDPRPRLSLDEFLAVVSEGKRHYRGWARRFGRRATGDEMARLLELVEREGDPVRLASMLMAFVEPLPAGPQPLLRFARSDVAGVRDAAIEALALYADPAVAAVSREMLAAGSVEGARLLALNYDQQQFDQLVGLLPRTGDAFQIHGLGIDVLEVCGNRPEAAAGLIWMYEASPCSFCRNSAVSDLVEIDRLPPDIAAECRDDCSDETRELVEAHEQPVPAAPPSTA